LFLFSLLSLGAQTANYFPLAPGSQWVYRGSFASETLTLKVGAQRQINGRAYYDVEGYASKALPVRLAESGAYVYWDDASQQEAPFLDFSGVTYTNPASECREQARAEVEPGKYVGPAGRFDDAREIRFSPGICADTGSTSEVFGPNLGMLRRTVTSFIGPKQFDLVYAQIGGVTYLNDAQVSFALSVGAVPGEGGSTSITGRFVLTNHSGADLVLDFLSSQRYDFRVLDAAGDTIHTWSSTRLFLAVVGQETVKDERVWQETFAVSSLRPGNYSLEGFLTNNDGKRYRATVGFVVR
jgi:hypothetical protein